MKHKLLGLLFALLISNMKAQTFYMCSGAGTTTNSSGNLYDSGGPSGYYSSYEDCQFLIKTNCAGNGNITLNFSSFSTEQGYDYITVYNGSTTASPVLGGYWGTGTIPPMIANSGYMLITFHSDGSSNYSGFAATWSFSNLNCAPQADFNMNVNACQGKVNFTDVSTYNPSNWIWNFGDGTASSLQSPAHTYTAPGTYYATLIVSNTLGNSTITKSLSVNPITFSIGYNGVAIMNSAISFTTDNTSGQVYTWNFGDGGLAGSANAIHTFTALGTYTVGLTIASGTCITTSTMQIVLKDGVGVSEFQGLTYQASLSPNPFAGETHLNLQLAKATHLKIEVLNQLGQLVKVIADENMLEGEYMLAITSLPAGIYYVTIRQGDTVRTLKLVSAE